MGRVKGCGVVHHKDEDRSNNDISNLAVMHRECHVSHHNKGKKWPPMTDEERKKRSIRQKEVFANPELREKLSQLRRGKPWSANRRAAQEARNKLKAESE